MSELLKKGGNVSLTSLAKNASTPLRRVVVACGWNVNTNPGEKPYDLDLSAAGLNVYGKVTTQKDPTDLNYQEWFIWANHRYPSSKCIVFKGDNRTGAGAGDDEQIEVDLDKVPNDIDRILFEVVIWQAEKRRQTFDRVEKAFIRIFDAETGLEFARFNLSADFSGETLVIFGELYRRNGEWKFRAIGQGYTPADFRTEHNIEHAFETEFARYSN